MSPILAATQSVDAETKRQEHERRACAVNAVSIAMAHRGAQSFTDADAQAVSIIEQVLGNVAGDAQRRFTPQGFVPGDTRGVAVMAHDAVERALAEPPAELLAGTLADRDPE